MKKSGLASPLQPLHPPKTREVMSARTAQCLFVLGKFSSPEMVNTQLLGITPPLTGQLLLVGAAEGEWESRESSLGWLAHAPTTTLGGRQGPSLLAHSCAYLRPYDVSC